jgi:hypothetical protein
LFSGIALRVNGHARYDADYVFVADFGFYKNGLLSVQMDNTPGGRPYSVKLFVFTRSQYLTWLEYFFAIVDHICLTSSSVFEGYYVLSPVAQSVNTTMPGKDVYYVIIQSCSRNHSGSYYVDAHFLNPNGQLLDYRDIPSLIVIPIAIPLFSLLLLSWITYIFVKQSKFLAIHVCLGIILTLYIVYLILLEVTLKRASVSDDSNPSTMWLIVFQAFYDFALFSTLVIASGGWCLLNVSITVREVASAVVGVSIFVASIFLQSELDLDLWNIAVILLQLFSVIWLIWQIWRSTRAAQKVIRAHLLVIQHGGILPSSTPIYQKLVHYQIFLYLVALSFLLVFISTANLSFFGAANWVGRMIDHLLQFIILASVCWLYRPRGEEIDKYMQRDNGDGARDEVVLEDLESLEADNRTQGMKEWNSGMNLPLEPVLVSSRDPRPLLSKSSPLAYTAVSDLEPQ